MFLREHPTTGRSKKRGEFRRDGSTALEGAFQEGAVAVHHRDRSLPGDARVGETELMRIERDGDHGHEGREDASTGHDGTSIWSWWR